MVARGRKLIAFREVEGVAHDDSDLKSNRKVVAGKKVGYVQEDSMARRLQLPCRRFLRERGDSFLSLLGQRFGADLGYRLL